MKASKWKEKDDLTKYSLKTIEGTCRAECGNYGNEILSHTFLTKISWKQEATK